MQPILFLSPRPLRRSGCAEDYLATELAISVNRSYIIDEITREKNNRGARLRARNLVNCTLISKQRLISGENVNADLVTGHESILSIIVTLLYRKRTEPTCPQNNFSPPTCRSLFYGRSCSSAKWCRAVTGIHAFF